MYKGGRFSAVHALTKTSGRRRGAWRVAALASTFTLAVVCSMGIASATSGKPSAKQLVSAELRLDYYPTGYQAPFFVALHFGYYKNAGINLNITPGTGSVTTVKETASGKNTFGFASVPEIALLASSDKNSLVSFCGFFQSDPSAIISLKTDPITSPSQLDGKKLGMIVAGTSLPFTAFVQAAHLNSKKFTVVGLTYSDLLSSLASGKVTALWNWGPTQGAEENAIKPIAPPLYAYKYVTMLSSSLVATKATVQNNPKLVRGFVKATIQGINWSVKHPRTALQIMKSYDPTLTLKVNKTVIEDLKTFMHTPNSKGHSFCWVSPKDIAATQSVLRKYDHLPSSVNLSKIITDKFVPANA